MKGWTKTPIGHPQCVRKQSPRSRPFWDAALGIMSGIVVASSIAAVFAEDDSQMHRVASEVMQWSAIAFSISYAITAIVRWWMGKDD